MDFNQAWNDFEFVAFDTETSGAYPLGSDVVEFGAVRWKNGKVVDTYQTLLKPREKMSDFIIGIHGITNEMVADAPIMAEKIHEIADFMKGAIHVAHHAPFDMGFMAIEFEKAGIPFFTEPAICTSLLARKVIPESVNHKLQTLIPFLGIEKGTAHRAADDARACLEVGLHCMGRIGYHEPISKVYDAVGKELLWKNFSLHREGDLIRILRDAIEHKKSLDISYAGGSTTKKDVRRISPIGLVLNPDGDYVMAKCHRDGAQKRFYLEKMSGVQLAL